MRIDSPLMTNAVITGSFSGSFVGVGNFTGLEADSVEFANVLNKPTLVSGSSQIDVEQTINFTAFSQSIADTFSGLSSDFNDLTNKPTLVSGSSQIDITGTTGYTSFSSSIAADIASNLAELGAIGSFTASLDTDLTTLSLPANTTISSFGASLVDDADASAARTTLGVDAAGTDNSTDVTLVTTSHDYLSIAGQAITLGTVDISDDTNLTAGTGVTLTGDTLSIGQAVGTGDSVTFASLTTTGNVTIQGDLSVLGDAVEIQVGSLSIEDKNILVASGAADSAAADGAGITIGGANESLTWNHANSRFNLSDDLNVEGNITLTGTVDGRDLATDGAKLDLIAANANNYTHPTYTGRTIDTSGAEVLDEFTSDTSGHVTNITKRTMTLADLGYTGATDANNYSLPLASYTVRGGVKITSDTVQSSGFVTHTNTAGRTYGVQLDASDRLVVNVPWVDTNTTYTRASFIDQDVNTTSNVHFEGLMVGQTTGATANTIRCVGDIVAYYSDDRLKNRIGNLTDALSKVNSLNGFTYTPNETALALGVDQEEVRVGVSAQEVQAVLPEAVKDAPVLNTEGYLTVQYEKIVPLLIEAIKELTAKVEELEKK